MSLDGGASLCMRCVWATTTTFYARETDLMMEVRWCLPACSRSSLRSRPAEWLAGLTVAAVRYGGFAVRSGIGEARRDQAARPERNSSEEGRPWRLWVG